MALLQQPPNTQLYNTVGSSWPRGPRITVEVDDYPEHLSLPLAFFQGGGENTLRFVEELVQSLVNEQGQLSHIGGEPLDLTEPPQAGQRLAFTPIAAGTVFTWAHGPDGRYRGRPQPPSDPFDDSASLSSSQVSSLQSGLRDLIIARDGECIISNSSITRSQAAHLAPKHRLDIYRATLGGDFDPPPYKTSHAVMLQTDLHKHTTASSSPSTLRVPI